jgi:hypothetical protein
VEVEYEDRIVDDDVRVDNDRTEEDSFAGAQSPKAGWHLAPQ